MSYYGVSRRTEVQVAIDGADITTDIKPYFMSLTYTDSEEDESDDLQLQLQDRDALWLTYWLERAIEASAASKMSISARIIPINWGSGGGVLPTGKFEMDGVKANGPGGTITLKGTSLPYSSPIRQTKKSKAWESYYLKGIASEMAGNAGLRCVYESAHNPFYGRVEQEKQSDIQFLSDLCHDAGISLKCTDGAIVLFDQAEYEAKPPVLTIRRGPGAIYKTYDLETSSAETQYAKCRVSYTDPATGKLVEGTATADGDDGESGQCLEITAKVKTTEEAEALAKKWLRMKNKFTRTISFTMPGNTALVSGVNVKVENFGGWSGKYMVKKATHTVGGSGGYETKITLRRIVEGY